MTPKRYSPEPDGTLSEDADGQWMWADDVASAIADAVAQERAWRDIATAPKDGTRILVCGGTYHSCRPAELSSVKGSEIVRWSQRRSRWEVPYTDTLEDYADFVIPTHWQPLLAPPTTKGT